MVKFQKGNKIGHRFTSEDQPKNKGRKPRLYKQLREALGKKVGWELEENDFQDIMRALVELPPEKLKALTRDAADPKKPNEKTPAWILMLVSHINACIRYGRVDALDFVFDRVFGSPTQKVEGAITTKDDNPDLSMLSTDELVEFNRILDKIRKGGK